MTNQRKLIGVGISIVLILFLSACNKTTSETQENTDLYDYDVEERIKELGLELRIPGAPVANYVNAVEAGDLVFMAGKGPRSGESSFITGKVGSDLTLEQGYEAARLAAIEQLSALKAEIGDLNRVVRIVKVLGMVNADPEFTDHSKVVNGFSDLMVEVFGERGKHARAAVGMSSLPLGFACEVEMVVQIRE
jgi:enamine deaminase RidA (YjgF/YER057c/UK114 family)